MNALCKFDNGRCVQTSISRRGGGGRGYRRTGPLLLGPSLLRLTQGLIQNFLLGFYSHAIHPSPLMFAFLAGSKPAFATTSVKGYRECFFRTSLVKDDSSWRLSANPRFQFFFFFYPTHPPLRDGKEPRE